MRLAMEERALEGGRMGDQGKEIERDRARNPTSHGRNVDVGSGTNQAALQIGSPSGDFRAFGSAVRSQVGAGIDVPTFGFSENEMTGVDAKVGTFHMHGGIISVNAGGSSLDVGALGLVTAAATAQAHTPGTAFVVAAANDGTSTRLRGPAGVTQSPFLWQQRDEPPRSVPGDPASPFVGSIQGADLFVETDCSSTSCSGGSDPHLMIYSESCVGAGGPWFDVVRGLCR